MNIERREYFMMGEVTHLSCVESIVVMLCRYVTFRNDDALFCHCCRGETVTQTKICWNFESCAFLPTSMCQKIKPISRNSFAYSIIRPRMVLKLVTNVGRLMVLGFCLENSFPLVFEWKIVLNEEIKKCSIQTKIIKIHESLERAHSLSLSPTNKCRNAVEICESHSHMKQLKYNLINK